MRRLYFAFSAFALALAACQLFVDDLYVDVPGVDRPPTLEDPTPLPASPDLCQHARVPPPPEAGGGSNVGALFFAAKTYQFAPANAPAPGFDLDDLCTGYDASRTSTSACIPPTSDTDDDGGVDNAFSRVAVFKTFGDPEQALNDNAAEGSLTLLVQITDYNGLPDDDEVSVAFLAVADPDCDGGCPAPQPNDRHPRPTFIPGADTWRYFEREQESIFSNLEIHVTTSTHVVKGYVTAGTLVIDRGATVSLPLSDGKLELIRGTLTGRLGKADGGGDFELTDVVVGGIVPSDQFLSFVHHIRLGMNGGLCGDKSVTSIICNLRDVRADMDASLPCNAISLGFQFDAVRANLGADATANPPAACDGSVVVPTCDDDGG